MIRKRGEDPLVNLLLIRKAWRLVILDYQKHHRLTGSILVYHQGIAWGIADEDAASTCPKQHKAAQK